MLTMTDVCTTFNRNTVDEMCLFKDFSFHVDDGEFVSIVGSNGSGKTTLLNLICGTTFPDAGNIFFKDKDITKMSEYKRARFIGRVFQDPKMGTCSNLTVLENFALMDNKNKIFGLTGAVSKKRFDYYRDLLKRCNMGLEDRMNQKVGSLSGGQRQAIALVLSGMTDVELLILDEHTAALDPKSSEIIMDITNDFITTSKMTAVMVTHNLRFATEYGTRLIMMDDGKMLIDRKDKEKENTTVDELLSAFNEISLDRG